MYLEALAQRPIASSGRRAHAFAVGALHNGNDFLCLEYNLAGY
jgi:hypothetical protein